MKKILLLMVLLVTMAVMASGCASEETSAASTKFYYANTVFPDKPIAPKNLMAEADHSRIVLSWQMPAWEDRYPFDLYRWSEGLAPKLLDTVPAGVHTYTDTSASSGLQYFYLVVTRKDGAETSPATAQIAGIALEPSSSLKPPIWARNGVTPPQYSFDGSVASQAAWSEDRIKQIRDRLPWVFVDETCQRCSGGGIITLGETNSKGLPDLTWCPDCKGTGTVTNIYPKS